MGTQLTSKWKGADEAFARGQQAYLDWCREIAKLYAEGDATQDEIAGRYGKEVTIIKYACRVGQDDRLKVYNINSLPKSTKVLYELTTLPDKDFEELCKPTTTQAVILEHKRRLAAPISDTRNDPPPSKRPPCPGVEGIGPGLWRWSEGMEEWIQQPKYEEHRRVDAKTEAYINDQMASQNSKATTVPGKATAMSARDWLKNYVAFCKEDVLTQLLEALRRIEHPDRGGNTEITAVLNQLISERK